MDPISRLPGAQAQSLNCWCVAILKEEKSYGEKQDEKKELAF
jgi:hypothetical protein